MKANFPTRAPVGLIAGLLLAVLSIVPIIAAWQSVLSPLERFYLGQYTTSYLSATPVGTVASFFKGSKQHVYRVLIRNGHPLVWGSDPRSAPVSVRVVSLPNPAGFHAWLRANVYGSREISDLLRTPAGIWAFTALSLLFCGSVLDYSRRKRAREGQQLRGGELLTVEQFNRATKGDGFSLYVQR